MTKKKKKKKKAFDFAEIDEALPVCIKIYTFIYNQLQICNVESEWSFPYVDLVPFCFQTDH